MADDSYDGIVWFAIGATLGAGLALLFAPWSGADARGAIASKTGEGREALAQQGRELMDRGRDIYERGRQMADEAANYFERGRKIVDDTVSNLREQA